MGELSSQYGAGAIDKATYRGNFGEFYGAADKHYQDTGKGRLMEGRESFDGIFKGGDYNAGEIKNPQWLKSTSGLAPAGGATIGNAIKTF